MDMASPEPRISQGPARGGHRVGPAAAVRYTAAGWHVLPVRPPADPCPDPSSCPCKAPLTTHGFLDATTAPDVIGAWWRRWPDANLAIATGAPGPDVLDIDQHGEAGNGFAAFGRLKCAGLLAGALAMVETPSGGLHVYFAGTDQDCGALRGHHLDFKARGGYVLAPPSVVHGQPYTLLDHRPGSARLSWAAARALLDPPRPLPPRRGSPGDIGGLAAWLARQGEGNRNSALFWAACTALGSGCSDLEPLAVAAMTAGLSEDETRRTIASAERRAPR
jgi:hypothetical protein